MKPNFRPRLSTSFNGSTPGERTKKIGVALVVSSYDRATELEKDIFYPVRRITYIQSFDFPHIFVLISLQQINSMHTAYDQVSMLASYTISVTMFYSSILEEISPFPVLRIRRISSIVSPNLNSFKRIFVEYSSHERVLPSISRSRL